MATWTGAQQEERMGRAQWAATQTGLQTSRWQLKQQQEAWELKKQGAKQAGELAGKFLSAWSGAMGDVKGMYKASFSALTNLANQISSGATAGTEDLDEISKMIQNEYQTFRADYGEAEKEFIGGAQEEAALRRGMATRLSELGTPDYEGEMGAAVADVRAQSEVARQSEMRRLLGMGIDPSSGRFGALSRKSYLDESRNTAIAMNLARRGEKERVSDLAIKGMGVLDPTKSGTLAMDIRRTGTSMLGQTADIAKARADIVTSRTKALSDIASTTGSQAGGYASNIMNPLGEMAGYYMGRAGSNLPTNSVPSALAIKRSTGPSSGVNMW